MSGETDPPTNCQRAAEARKGRSGTRGRLASWPRGGRPVGGGSQRGSPGEVGCERSTYTILRPSAQWPAAVLGYLEPGSGGSGMAGGRTREEAVAVGSG